MFDIKNLDKKKKADLSLVGLRGKVKTLQSYYLQGGIWYNTKTGKRERSIKSK